MGARETASPIESDHTDGLAVDEDRINYPGLQLGALNLVSSSFSSTDMWILRARSANSVRMYSGKLLVRLQPVELNDGDYDEPQKYLAVFERPATPEEAASQSLERKSFRFSSSTNSPS